MLDVDICLGFPVASDVEDRVEGRGVRGERGVVGVTGFTGLIGVESPSCWRRRTAGSGLIRAEKLGSKKKGLLRKTELL